MHKVPDAVMTQYQTVLKRKVADVSRHADYKKWLRYFWDFCAKYPVPESKSERVRLFIEKLKEKKQKPDQLKQAAYAVSLFFESQETKAVTTTPSAPMNHNSPYPPLILRGGGEAGGVTVKGEFLRDIQPQSVPKISAPQASLHPVAPHVSKNSHYNDWRCLEKTGFPEWDKLIDKLAAEIKLRHYSRKTLKTYADWSRKFQSFLHNKPPDELSAADVKTYLTFQAVKCRVSASTQDQAHQARRVSHLPPLFRHTPLAGRL